MADLGYSCKRKVESLLASADARIIRPIKSVQYAPTKGRWFVACGDGRIDKMSPDEAIRFSSGVILAFRLNGKATDVIESWSAGIRWPGGWSLHFHLDPERFDWPNHPKVHYQFTCPESNTIVSTPPYANLRPPADVGAIEWIEWAISIMA